jgi:anti-sigma regulatory factor (Ser/Thr protein kinase)
MSTESRQGPSGIPAGKYGEPIGGVPAAAVCERVFPGVPAQVREARRWVRTVTGAVCAPVADDAALVVSELATNALLHTASGLPGGKFAVGVQGRPAGIVICVRDQGRAAGQAAGNGFRPGPGDGHGRGLAIVTALGSVWGTAAGPGWPAGHLRDPHDPLAAGRCIWCFLTRPPAAAGETAAAGGERR